MQKESFCNVLKQVKSFGRAFRGSKYSTWDSHPIWYTLCWVLTCFLVHHSANAAPGSCKWWFQCLNPWHLYGRPWLSHSSLAWAWPAMIVKIFESELVMKHFWFNLSNTWIFLRLYVYEIGYLSSNIYIYILYRYICLKNSNLQKLLNSIKTNYILEQYSVTSHIYLL